jgi:hypothetical protein
VGYGFEEELRPFGGVDTIIKVSTPGIFGLLDSGATAPVIGNT